MTGILSFAFIFFITFRSFVSTSCG
jgi:hypothetical protein